MIVIGGPRAGKGAGASDDRGADDGPGLDDWWDRSGPDGTGARLL